MGVKLLWIGLTFVVALTPLLGMRVLEMVGAVLMVIGAILLIMDK